MVVRPQFPLSLILAMILVAPHAMAAPVSPSPLSDFNHKPVAEVKLAADSGIAAARCELGRRYWYGQGGVEKNVAQAQILFQQSATSGFAKAQLFLGICYQLGLGVNQDNAQAVLWVTKAATQGDLTAQYLAGLYNEVGQMTQRNLQKAFEWYNAAERHGLQIAQKRSAEVTSRLIDEVGNYDFSPMTDAYEIPKIKPRLCQDENVLQVVSQQENIVRAADQDRAYGIALSNSASEYLANGDYKRAIDSLQKSFASGWLNANVQLSELYAKGEGVLRNDERAVALLKDAADRGCIQAQAKLGLCYIEGKVVTKNDASAIFWLQKAAQHNDIDSSILLFDFYQTGSHGLSVDMNKSFDLINALHKHNANVGAYTLGLMYKDGAGCKRDLLKALSLFENAASQSNEHSASASTEIGLMYLNGVSVVQNYNSALQFLEEPAEQGVKTAQEALALIYRLGLGVPKNSEIALLWHHRAFTVNSSDIGENIKVCAHYPHQKLLDPMMNVSFVQLKSSAKAGNAKAICELGRRYWYGDSGAKKDLPLAVKSFHLAAERGCPRASLYLGVSYQLGLGVAKNNKQALFWMKKAAEGQDAYGQYMLGLYYDAGEIVPQNLTTAQTWYSKSFLQGLQKALRRLMNVDERIYEMKPRLYSYSVKHIMPLTDFYTLEAEKEQKDFLR